MTVSRPTSPHLTIYKPQISTVLSITHRFTGLALVAGSALIVAWLLIVAYAPELYGDFYAVMASIPGQLCLIGWTAAFYYHLANGIRHLVWDMGKGLTVPAFTRSGWLVIVFTLALTAATWGMVYAS